jgi:hypothetical protein
MLYQPVQPNARTSTAVLAMHLFGNDQGHISGRHLASRGYTVLCANQHTVGTANSPYLIEDQAPDVALAMRYLRARREITTCERFPGEYGDTSETLFNYPAGWLEKRFLN